MLAATSTVIPSDGSSTVVFSGKPNTRVTWTLTGVGTLTQVDEFTDARGVAKAVFTPSVGDQIATVGVSYVA